MTDNENEVPLVYLLPGEIHLARRPSILRTILGSCVGVTFWCPRLGSARSAMAYCPGVRQESGLSDGRKPYVDFSIRDLARQFENWARSATKSRSRCLAGPTCFRFNPVAEEDKPWGI